MTSTKYCNVFAEGLGRVTGGAVSTHGREDARPVFMRARPLAYALREPVERALDQLRDGVLTPVERTHWATPIVPVVKKGAKHYGHGATVRDLEKLNAALKELEVSRKTCKDLLRERDENEVEVKKIIDKNTQLKRQLVEPHT
ncbi:hypothetical protein PYW07_002473 [Mythimna separata]|uniref:Uncharacterized protein n=1 Tax=Mythimna separata TaxID=271217 RepID=A0AAD7YNC7_MYTSE|nr:hypothetical protein PYW07_002473 [Mythimna separata]